MDNQEAGLAVRPRGELMPAMTVEEGVERFNAMKQFVHSVMRENEHFGIIPNTKKRTLFKPGAELLCSFFGLRAEFEAEASCVIDWAKEFFFFSYKCILRNSQGELVATCVGSANSREVKYRDRSVGEAYATPEEKAAATGMTTKKDRNGREYKVYIIPNPNLADQVNTIQKMAQKRAFIGAALIGANASAFFTQDLEDEYATVAGGPSKSARSAAVEARLRGEPAPEPPRDVIDELPPFEGWVKRIHTAAMARGIAEDLIDAAMERQATKDQMDVFNAPEKWYAAVLAWVEAGKFDFLKPKAPAPEPPRADAAFAADMAKRSDDPKAKSFTKAKDAELDSVFAAARRKTA